MKKILLVILPLCFIFATFAENSAALEPAVSAEDEMNTGDIEIIRKTKPEINWIAGFAPAVIFNIDDSNKSAPSPIVYPFGFGISVYADKFISFQPRLSFFTNYYLYNDGSAKPAEIENRTATAFSFLIDLPAVFTFDLKHTHFLELGLGAGILARFAILSSGVDDSEEGESGTVSDDLRAINKSFWENANFLYIENSFAYLFRLNEKIKIGPEIRLYIPCGSLFTKGSMNGGMFSAGIKVRI